MLYKSIDHVDFESCLNYILTSQYTTVALYYMDIALLIKHYFIVYVVI